MEEDILTRRREAIGAGRYTYCTACGNPIPRLKSVLVPGEEIGETRSEQGEVCPTCAIALRTGELLPAPDYP